LFFKRYLLGESKLGLSEGDFLDIAKIRSRLSDLEPDERRPILSALQVIVPLFVEDEFIAVLNQNLVQGSVLGRLDLNELSDRSYSQYPHRMDPASGEWRDAWTERSFYDAHADAFEDTRWAEPATQANQMDCLLGNLFGEDLEEAARGQTSVSAVLDEIEATFPRSSNTRDRYLEILCERIRAGTLEASLAERERLAGLVHSEERRDRAFLLVLQQRLDDARQAGKPLSFEEELRLIVGLRDAGGEWVKGADGRPVDQGYFPEMNEFRDDLLRELEWRQAGTPSQLESVRRYYTFDFRTQLRKEVAKRDAQKENLIVAIRNLKVEEKHRLLLWLAGLTSEKPACIRKLEGITFQNWDALREAGIVSTADFPNAGLSVRREFLKQILLGDTRSVVHMNSQKNQEQRGAAALMAVLWQAFMQKYRIQDSPKTQRMLKVCTIILNQFNDDPQRQLEIMTRMLIELERVSADTRFSSMHTDEKLGRIARVFLEATGIVGIKIGQYLAISNNFGLSQRFKKELRGLTERERGMDKSMLHSVLEQLEVPERTISRIDAAAGVKTVISVAETDDIFKVKNLEVYYHAQRDIERGKKALVEIEREGMINSTQRAELEQELEETVENDADFEWEARNVARAADLSAARSDQPHWFVRAMEVSSAAQGIDVSRCRIERVSLKGPVTANLLIREGRAPGVSLKKIMAGEAGDFSPAEVNAVKRTVAIEAVREIFEDGYFHGDLHPGNIFVSRQADGTLAVSLIDWGTVAFTAMPRLLSKQEMATLGLAPDLWQNMFVEQEDGFHLVPLRKSSEANLGQLLAIFKSKGASREQQAIERLLILKMLKKLSQSLGLSLDTTGVRMFLAPLGDAVPARVRDVVDAFLEQVRQGKSLDQMIETELAQISVSTRRALDKTGYLFGEETIEPEGAEAGEENAPEVERPPSPAPSTGVQTVPVAPAVDRLRISHEDLGRLREALEAFARMQNVASADDVKGKIRPYFPAIDEIHRQFEGPINQMMDVIQHLGDETIEVALDEE
ncbi:MAG: AarF/UbiB family protein, partial [Candidatus Omnitrophica bacterium]|nr:AarF/UbiB family protein [Candidatus Omnitrophota bacterium]